MAVSWGCDDLRRPDGVVLGGNGEKVAKSGVIHRCSTQICKVLQ